MFKEEPDCCDSPDLGGLLCLFERSSRAQTVMRCSNCGQYWLWDEVEFMNFDGPDRTYNYYKPLTKEEAEEMMESHKP